jgi:hypothetical protein
MASLCIIASKTNKNQFYSELLFFFVLFLHDYNKMARPRQRKITKNPSRKVSLKKKNPKKTSFGQTHPVLRKYWDKKKTLKQNYEAVGLISHLRGNSGGNSIMQVVQSVLLKHTIKSSQFNL